MSFIEAVILGLVEGITEFLPISSTGHLILTQSLLGLHGPAVEALLIIIQGPAILAVCWEFRQKLLHVALSLHREPASRRFVVNLLIVFLPVAALALLFGDEIKAVLFNPVSVAIALVVGGFIILWAERRKHSERVQDVDQLTAVDALKLGAFQALSLIPGTSRSGATIIGGLLCGLSRRTAAEFSFFVAIPVLLCATAYESWKERAAIAAFESGPLIVSCVVSFVSALLAVKFLIRYVSRHSFAAFAWYRIVFGGIILVTAWTGLVHW
ncbi:MAG TPA: undecaprenyl-diphosphate phosphatase [Steroidobacteraceae bacterium]|jgi:undecaprenyl-diphosphatase|nr:undecaprenyl-diphosphate phosphatase [Steroidobacteraceae bacterium]